jgi:hypothetical protein
MFLHFNARYLPSPSHLTRFYHPELLWRVAGQQIIGARRHENFSKISFHLLSSKLKHFLPSKVSQGSAYFPQAARLQYIPQPDKRLERYAFM